eukprot:7223078-Ditylum_brightwellii.AAC.1
MNIQQEVDGVSHLAESFSEYISLQPQHVQQLLGTLDASDVDFEYWIITLNNGRVTIATDNSVAQKTGYFATILHTPECQLQFQGPLYYNNMEAVALSNNSISHFFFTIAAISIEYRSTYLQ